MNYKEGDKVKVRSKEWWDAQPKNKYGNVQCGVDKFTKDMVDMCGKTVTISVVAVDGYLVDGSDYYWTDEMFEGPDSGNVSQGISDQIIKDIAKVVNKNNPGISDQLIKDIAEVVKKNNLGVSVSEKDGKIIIEPLKVEEEDYPYDAPVVAFDKIGDWHSRYYAGKGRCIPSILIGEDTNGAPDWKYIIPSNKFNVNNINESMMFNLAKKRNE